MKLDKRRKYYLILDCETATLPYAERFSGNEKTAVAIAKPLIYDLGYLIIDRKGNVYKKVNYLVSEIFSVPQIFNTAYYKDKKPIYLEMLENKEIILKSWTEIRNELLEDCALCYAVGAYNAMFDFKKAIPFTEQYIEKLYSDSFYQWQEWQHSLIDKIAQGEKFKNPKGFDERHFSLGNNHFPLFDIWALACTHLLNNDKYKEVHQAQGWHTSKGKYYSTNAENCYRFLTKDYDFQEMHTALADCEIEKRIFSKVLKPTVKNLDLGIEFFPFRKLGKIVEK